MFASDVGGVVRRTARTQRASSPKGTAMNNPILAPNACRTPVAVHRATTVDIRAAAAALAAAFFDDPVYSWCFPDVERRHRICQPWFEAVVAAYLRQGHVHTTADAVAAAVWLPSGAVEDDDLGDELMTISGRDADRLAVAFELMGTNHPEQPHHYLFLLGTRPERQSQGIGSKLMEPMLALADGEGVPAYLEATSAQNMHLYLRHGFEVVGEIRLPDGPSLWPMWREPVTSVH